MAKYIDLHSHIAWGIDDGMPCVEDAVSSLESAKKDGIVGICSTPHFIPGQLDVHIYNEMKKDESYPYLFWWGSYDE